MSMLIVKKGDRTETDSLGRISVITPPGALHNFGPVSSRDPNIYTCERPGGDPEDGERIVTKQAVAEWARYIRDEQGVQNVVVLMGAEEVKKAYDEPGLLGEYKLIGMKVYHIPMTSPDAADKIFQVQKDAEDSNEKVALHCTHGMGRSGRTAALWLVKRYGLSVLEATEETLETAREHGVERMGAPHLLEEWMQR